MKAKHSKKLADSALSYSQLSWRMRALCLTITLLSLSPAYTQAESKNGFDLSGASVPIDQIMRGGPPRDGIPAIDAPVFTSVAAADFLRADDRVLGLNINGEAKAYPINILNWHEIVNDVVGGTAVAITWCPLCGSGVVFAADIDGERRSFGVSGLLYQSDVLLYDRASESLFSQLEAEAISGPLLGQRLRPLPVSYSSWSAWRARYPEGLVLSRDTGYRRDYSRDPYAGYDKSQRLYFAVNNAAPPLLHPKERVFGVSHANASKAYPVSELEKLGDGEFRDSVGGAELSLNWNGGLGELQVQTAAGEPLIPTTAFWFAWFTFNPTSQVYQVQ